MDIRDEEEVYLEAGDVYVVELDFFDKSKQEIISYVRETLQWKRDILHVRDNHVKLLWSITPGRDVIDLEMTLFYAMKEEELGFFRHEQIYSSND